jgi:murein DD-endopeptidase MepM/ murein hydrolase activator NlpD
MEIKSTPNPTLNKNLPKHGQKQFVIIDEGKKNDDKKTQQPNKLLVKIISTVHEIIYEICFLYFRVICFLYFFIKGLIANLQHFSTVMSDRETRDVSLLKLKIQYHTWLKQANHTLNWYLAIFKNLYLAVLVIVIVSTLKMASVYAKPNLNHKSFISQVFDNYSFLNNENNSIKTVATTVTTKNKAIKDQFPLNKVLIKEGDTVEKVAENEGLTVDSVVLNNNIDKDKPLPKELIVPWQDGYVIFPKEDTNPKDIAEKYSVDEKLLYSYNEDKINYETGKFVKESIPTKNFDKIKEVIKTDKDKLEAEEKMKQEKENQVKLAKSYQDQFSNNNSSGGENIESSGDKYANSFSDTAKSSGFIWPTKGTISRCIQPGHPGCDIANFAMPPVYAVQDATVYDVYRFTVYGYGNAVVLDHGNGLRTLYAHLNEIYVSKGQTVSQGQAIGQMGNTGNSTGTHLHFEVIQSGVKQNPLNYLP